MKFVLHLLIPFTLFACSSVFSQCNTTAPSNGTINSSGIPSTAGLNWSSWATAPTGCPTAGGSTQITGGAFTITGAPNKPTYFASGSVDATVTLPSNNDKVNIVVCPGAVLMLSRGAMNSTSMNLLVMPGATLKTSSIFGFPGNQFLYGTYLASADMTIQDIGTQIYIANTGIFQLASSTTTSHSLTINSNSIGLYSEGSIDVNDLYLNSSPIPFLCVNSASSCTRIRGTYGASNSNDQIQSGAAGGTLKLDKTTGTVTFNSRVTSSSTMAVCTYGATYCKNAGGSCCTSTCTNQSTSAFANTAYNTSCGSLPSNCNIPLAIRLLYFKASKGNEGVIVRWATALEDKTIAYIVERSNDGREWEKVGEVTTQTSKEYRLLDPVPNKGFNYYLLIELDKETTGTVRSVDMIKIEEGETQVRLSPNPSNGTFTVNISDELPSYSMYILDVSGKNVGSYTLQPGSTTISDLRLAGLYFVKVQIKNEVQILRLIIQN